MPFECEYSTLKGGEQSPQAGDVLLPVGFIGGHQYTQRASAGERVLNMARPLMLVSIVLIIGLIFASLPPRQGGAHFLGLHISVEEPPLSTTKGGPKTACFTDSVTDLAFARCLFCTTPRLLYVAGELAAAGDAEVATVCDDTEMAVVGNVTSTGIARVLLRYGRLQGWFWEDDGLATACVAHLVQHMPRRDSVLLFAEGLDTFLELLLEHTRFALLSRGKQAPPFTRTVPWDVFLDYVLPHAFLDEKRDLAFRWRPRFTQLLGPLVKDAVNVTAAMHIVAEALPKAAAAGILEFDGTAVPGDVIRWKSETSPMNLSPEQVVFHAGSCTGTAITMAAAARSVGIPARIAGCSQSIVGDDHHWIEFYDPLLPGPFNNTAEEPDGLMWHTREGTSAGNAGGPWDAPSSPMNLCLEKLIPGDPLQLNTIWVSKWSGEVNMPMQWANDNLSTTFAFVGAENRCGAYCQAWGCGDGQSQHWTQEQCAV